MLIAIPSHFFLSQTSLPFLLKYVLITVGNSKIEYFLKTIFIFIFSFVFKCKHFFENNLFFIFFFTNTGVCSLRCAVYVITITYVILNSNVTRVWPRSHSLHKKRCKPCIIFLLSTIRQMHFYRLLMMINDD